MSGIAPGATRRGRVICRPAPRQATLSQSLSPPWVHSGAISGPDGAQPRPAAPTPERHRRRGTASRRVDRSVDCGTIVGASRGRAVPGIVSHPVPAPTREGCPDSLLYRSRSSPGDHGERGPPLNEGAGQAPGPPPAFAFAPARSSRHRSRSAPARSSRHRSRPARPRGSGRPASDGTGDLAETPAMVHVQARPVPGMDAPGAVRTRP